MPGKPEPVNGQLVRLTTAAAAFVAALIALLPPLGYFHFGYQPGTSC